MELRAHQRAAVERYTSASIIPLFFAVGTGKSVTALAIASEKYRRGDIDRVLIVAPNHIDEQWATEQIPLFFSSFEAYADVPAWLWTKKDKVWGFKQGCLNLGTVNVDKFAYRELRERFIKWALEGKCMVVVDESTRIKNLKAQRTKALVYGFSKCKWRGRTCIENIPLTAARCILTGTPTTGSPHDVYAPFEFLSPFYFRMTEYQFNARYLMQMFLRDGDGKIMQAGGRAIKVALNEEAWKEIKKLPFLEASTRFGISPDTYAAIQQQERYEGSYKNVEELRRKIAETAMFVRIEDVNDMPEKNYIRKVVDMGAEQAKAYKDMKAHYVAEYKGQVMRAKSKLTLSLRLQQIASGFIVDRGEPRREDYEDDEEWAEAAMRFLSDPPPSTIAYFPHNPKLEQLREDLKELEDAQVLVVCHFSAEASMLYEALTEDGYRVCLQTGWKKIGTIDEYKEGKYQVMVANEKLISMGFNLQMGHYIIFYSNTFSLEDRLQTEGRIYRTGQKNTCFYLDYVCRGTVDETVWAAIGMRKNLADYIINKSVEEFLGNDRQNEGSRCIA